jgi:hypothetical protein
MIRTFDQTDRRTAPVISYKHDSIVKTNSRYSQQVCCSKTDIILPPLFTAWQTKLTPKQTLTLIKESRQVHEHWLLAQSRQGWLPKNIMIGYSQYAVSNQFQTINFELTVRTCIYVHNSVALSLQSSCAETLCLRVTENAKLKLRSRDCLVSIIPGSHQTSNSMCIAILSGRVKLPVHAAAGYKWVELYLYYPCTSSR